MSPRIGREEGSALVIAVFAIAVMLMIGLATYSFVNTQQSQANREHLGESSFRLANAALNAQMFQVGSAWPGATASAYPSWCTSAGGAGAPCPDAAALSSSFTGPEYASSTCAGGVTNGWRTAVRDNGGGATSYYDPAVVPSQPSYDANGDGSVWVRAEGTARCRTRVVVALVRLSRVPLPFPRNVITANWISVTNNGRKVIVDTLGKYAQPPLVPPPDNAQAAGVAARCVGSATCISYNASKGQISPDTSQPNSGGNPVTLTADQINGLRLQAQTNSPPRYYGPGQCPSSLTGQLVFVEDMTGCGPYNSGGNSPGSPGVLVFLKGRLTLGGNGVFYGIVYAANQAPSVTGAVVTVQGTAAIQGSVAVDGPGGVVAGSSRTNVVFDPRAFVQLQALANATMVPNTWRQLPSS